MLKIPKKVADRIAANLKTYQGIAQAQKAKDVSEADTVTLVKDVLTDCFGYNKYDELTSELQIRGTFCDLAVKIDGKIRYLIEVKAAGVTLNDSHLRQTINYGANQGIEWVVLTNAIEWRLYRIKFGQPVTHEEVSSFNLLEVSAKREDDLKRMFLICREGISADALDVYHQHAQVLNRFTIAQVLLSEQITYVLRRELRRLFPDAKIAQEQIAEILANEVLKRDVIEGDKAKETQQRIKKLMAKLAKQNDSSKKNDSAAGPSTADPDQVGTE